MQPHLDGAFAGHALFLDFDGTLVDIAPTPDAVQVDAGLAPALAALRARFAGAFALVSGRRIATLDAFLAPHVFDAGGLHGLEIRAGGRMLDRPQVDRDKLRAAAASLSKRLIAWPGAFVEDKGCTIAAHWRLAPGAGAALSDALEEIVAGLGADWRLQRGKAVAEILPAHADKGRAVEALLAQPAYRGRAPIFFGDDATDEDAIRIVNARGGVSVNVGPRPSAATFRLPDPASVRALLARWAQDPAPDLLADLKG
ncbi:MAG: trehalose-phosphatase [Beijerinckiaceae bacterium]|jgi:trehalose 6-phosphate phosphatase